ncbi:molybdate ABC transporter substrate-binding protein [Breoghania sp. JC706]|uniref:molybdate ABC transporter substrate-binding protein n=1 Tax=Breoghania sp. JC706 TaxID=3117732 RepID=UPI00300A2F4A
MKPAQSASGASFTSRVLRRAAGVAVATGLAVAATLGSAQAAEKLTVFAAASMKDALEGIGAAYTKENGTEVVFSFASSSAIARQVEAGAPADVYISADVKWMDYLKKADAIDPATIRNVAANTLVVVAPKADAKPLELTKDALLERIGEGRLAIGTPESVPAGRYGKASLTKLGLWDAVEGKLAPMENVRVTLAAVARGEAPLGIVYGSDAAIQPDVAVVATFPDDSHAPIVYPGAVTTVAKPGAIGFLDYLSTPEARGIFAKVGFQPVD